MVQFFPALPAVLAWPEVVPWPSDPGSGGGRSASPPSLGNRSRDGMCAWSSGGGGVVWGCEKAGEYGWKWIGSFHWVVDLTYKNRVNGS